VCLLLLEVLAVVTEKLHFWKSKLPVHMNDALALEGMVVGTWVGVGFALVGHVHGELELQGTSLKKRAMLFDRFSLGDRIRRWSSSASRLPVFQQGKNIVHHCSNSSWILFLAQPIVVVSFASVKLFHSFV
jgi:hypothetical protein